jgi:hypothetical protein
MSEGPLRILRRPRAFGETKNEALVREYWQKLALMAPSEVTGFYLTFRPLVIGNLTPDEIRTDALASWWPWIGVALVVLVRLWATHRGPWWKGQFGAVSIATVAFILWVITMGHYVAYLSDLTIIQDRRIPAVFAAVFTFIGPYFYKGDPPPAPKPSAKPADIEA